MESIYALCIVAMLFLASIVNKSIYMEKRTNSIYLRAIFFNILSHLGYIGRNYANANHLVLLNIISNLVIYISGCAQTFLFLICNTNLNRLIYRLSFTLFIANCILTISSVWTKFCFEITPDGIYHRGSLYFLSSTIASIIMIFWISTLFFEYKRIPLIRKIHILCLGIFEVIAILLQASNGSMKIEFIGASFLLAIYYAFIIEVDGRVDRLTGVCSSRYYYAETERIRNLSNYTIFMIDANGLKTINDTKGHKAGDSLIIAVASSATQVFRKIGKVFRIGGDEFLVAAEKLEDSMAEDLLKKFTETLEEESIKTGMTVTASAGYATHLENENFQETLNRADSNMYINKRKYYENLNK